ncbi:uncharacterized protein LOC107473636 [Arachis duranensis]|uniref:Uncharacterized protein LOC107473636 n=1 Tax=Arachis duranensis TaxID=130453 RepID=A0A6P5N1Q6_ARADU|nr:uncharacterized protein LOC107473636 [Arachis duranensis]
MQIEGYWEYNKFYEEGVYNCAGCATPLYKSSTKFDSGYGWLAFFEGLLGAINRSVDAERAYHRNALVILEKLYTEVKNSGTCSICNLCVTRREKYSILLVFNSTIVNMWSLFTTASQKILQKKENNCAEKR